MLIAAAVPTVTTSPAQLRAHYMRPLIQSSEYHSQGHSSSHSARDASCGWLVRPQGWSGTKQGLDLAPSGCRDELITTVWTARCPRSVFVPASPFQTLVLGSRGPQRAVGKPGHEVLPLLSLFLSWERSCARWQALLSSCRAEISTCPCPRAAFLSREESSPGWGHHGELLWFLSQPFIHSTTESPSIYGGPTVC